MKNKLNKNNNIFQFNSNTVSIYDCFNYNQKCDCLPSYCNNCKQLCDSFYTSKLFMSPNVLFIILNMGKDNIYNIKIDFSGIIDISQFVLQKDLPKIIYN